MIAKNYLATILVTGANGQLASEIKEISVLFPFYQFFFESRQELPINDERKLKMFFEKQQIDFCINCAAYTAVDKAEAEEEKAFEINADAVEKLSEICKAHQSKFIHVSTDYVYDGTQEIPLKEENSVAPLNIYGQSKLRGEELALKKNPETLIIRTSWVYSSFGNNFVKTMLRLLTEKDAINVVSDQVGSPTYAADLASVIMYLIEKIEKGNNFSGIYNYCNEGITNWYEFAKAIKETAGLDCIINSVPTSAYKTAAQRPLYSVLNTEKIQEILEEKIPNWKDSLLKCLVKLDNANLIN
ncbi:MAG: dTDP-4-dehydrorhamnose reductase [Ginsengibacter sp.]